jgi:hypothetical protein
VPYGVVVVELRRGGRAESNGECVRRRRRKRGSANGRRPLTQAVVGVKRGRGRPGSSPSVPAR